MYHLSETFAPIRNLFLFIGAYTLPGMGTHSRPTRNAIMGRFTTPKPNTEAMRGSAMYRAMSCWNALPYEIAVTEGKHSFKRKVKMHYSKDHLGC